VYNIPYNLRVGYKKILTEIKMKKIALIGSTGSIGRQTLNVCRRNPDKFKIVSLAAGNNVGEFFKQVKEFSPKVATLANEVDSSMLVSGVDYFFGEKEDTPNSWDSLKTYFESTSLNAVKVSGIVTDVFDVKSFNNNYSVKYICDNDDPSLTMLQSIFKAAVSWVKTNHSDINWSEYDRNDDGYFDNLHFISNLTKTATLQGEYSPFWPHKWQINDAGKGNLNSPNGYLKA
jgi:hypothetical protein